MPVSVGINMDSRQFEFVREFLSRLSRPNAADLTRIERSVRVGFMQNFARQQVGGGNAWAPLAPRTRRERAMQGYGASGPMLRRTNAYAQTWTRVGGWRMLERTATGWVLHVSSDHPWAFTHELGNPGRNIPPRAVRYLDNGQQRVIANAVASWVDDMMAWYFT